MIIAIQQKRKVLTCRICSVLLASTFVFSSIISPQRVSAQTALNLPASGAMVTLSPSFNPTIIKGITIHPQDPLLFDFIIHPGDDNLQDEELQIESMKLIKYFMAALTVPEDEMWVNLSPYEKDRIIPQGFGDTEMGRDLLAQDYMLKQLTASLMYPENILGSAFWQRVYKKAQGKYDITDIPINTFNKIWILPDKVTIYEHENSAFVASSTLKVMLEEDYLALEHNSGSAKHGLGDVNREELTVVNEMISKIIKDILIPEIEREVNEGKTFANLRQIYNAVILATWYKHNLKGGLLSQSYIDRNKTVGIDHGDNSVNQNIYLKYVESLNKGLFNYIKEDYVPEIQDFVARKYFSGGVHLGVTKTDLVLSSPVIIDTLGDEWWKNAVLVTSRQNPSINPSTSESATLDKAMVSSEEDREGSSPIEQAKQKFLQHSLQDILTIEYFYLAEFLLGLEDDQVTEFVQSKISILLVDNLADIIGKVKAMRELITLPPGVDQDLEEFTSMLVWEIGNNDDDFRLLRKLADRIEVRREQMFRNIQNHFLDLGERRMLPQEIFHPEVQQLLTDYFYLSDNLRLLLLLSEVSVKFRDTMLESVDVDILIEDEVVKRRMYEQGKLFSIEMLPESKTPEFMVLEGGGMPIILSEVFRNSDLYGQTLFRVQRLFDDRNDQLTIIIENDGQLPSDPESIFQWFRSIEGVDTKSPIGEEVGRGLGTPIARKWVHFQGGNMSISLVDDGQGQDIVRTEITLPVLKLITIASEQAQGDSSSPVKASSPGGIDLNPAGIEMTKQGQGIDIDFFESPINLNLNNIEGFVPSIINIVPVMDFPLLLGITNPANTYRNLN